MPLVTIQVVVHGSDGGCVLRELLVSPWWVEFGEASRNKLSWIKRLLILCGCRFLRLEGQHLVINSTPFRLGYLQARTRFLFGARISGRHDNWSRWLLPLGLVQNSNDGHVGHVHVGFNR